LKTPKNIENFECMVYICDKIIPITEFENLNMYLISKVVDGIIGWIFYGAWYWYPLIKCNKNLKFKIFGWNSIQKSVFLHFFSNGCIIISSFQEKTTTISKRKRINRWALHYFSIFFCLIMFHESQTWGPMVIQKL